MSDLKFSVCMCVYRGDKPEYFLTAVRSIINQSLRPSEIVLVVDGPIPQVLEEAISTLQQEFQSFKVVRFEKNQGHSMARRASIENASCEWVAIMDSDDIAVPDRFEKQFAFLSKYPDVHVLGGQIAEFIDSTDNVVGRRIVPCTHEELTHLIKRRCPFNQMSVTMLRSPLIDVGNYQEWYCDEDYYLWIRMMMHGCRFANLPDILVYARVGKEMYQRRGGWKYFKSEAKLQKYMWKHGIIALPRLCYNVFGRFVIQVAMPNWLRGFVFQKLFRK